ncbi:DinB family protein [Saccharothrix sp.]|uniref:DinB family protein n=1 Tax=Saccharothrix sp. TaxID=1873460 RepID=UPI0028120631|nr:DinB family protein [Saccharothrix sp.]
MTAMTLSAEKTDLLSTLAKHRGFLKYTVQGITDEQARLTPTASALSLGGLIKHVRDVEESWIRFAVGGAELMESVQGDWENGFRLLPEESLADVLAAYEETARKTDELVASLDLNVAHALPEAPWFAKESWTVRRVLLHLIAETSQHAGHADIIRETLDGQKTMG